MPFDLDFVPSGLPSPGLQVPPSCTPGAETLAPPPSLTRVWEWPPSAPMNSSRVSADIGHDPPEPSRVFAGGAAGPETGLCADSQGAVPANPCHRCWPEGVAALVCGVKENSASLEGLNVRKNRHSACAPVQGPDSGAGRGGWQEGGAGESVADHSRSRGTVLCETRLQGVSG